MQIMFILTLVASRVCLCEMFYFLNDTLFCFLFQVNSILRHVGELLGYKHDDQLTELYTKTAWYFDEKFKKPGASYDAFKLAVTLVDF